MYQQRKSVANALVVAPAHSSLFKLNYVGSFPFNHFQTYLKMLNHVRPIWQKQLRENTMVVICFPLLYHQILHLYLSRLNYCHFCHCFLKNKIQPKYVTDSSKKIPNFHTAKLYWYANSTSCLLMSCFTSSAELSGACQKSMKSMLGKVAIKNYLA